jgi:hypothetical protein
MHAMRGSKDLHSRILGGIGKGSEGQTQLQYFNLAMENNIFFFIFTSVFYHQIGFSLKQVVPVSYYI